MLSPLGLCSIILDLALSWLSVLGSWHSVLGFYPLTCSHHSSSTLHVWRSTWSCLVFLWFVDNIWTANGIFSSLFDGPLFIGMSCGRTLSFLSCPHQHNFLLSDATSFSFHWLGVFIGNTPLLYHRYRYGLIDGLLAISMRWPPCRYLLSHP